MNESIINSSLGQGISMDDKFGKFPIYEFANKEENFHGLKDELMEGLDNLRMDNGVFYASVSKFYLFKSWTRDNFYANLAYLHSDPEKYKQTMQTMLDFYIKCENEHGKISWLIKDPIIKDSEAWRYLHPRMTKDLNEIHECWGFRQQDSVSMILFGIYLGETNNIKIIRGEEDRKIIQLIIDMFEAIKYDTFVGSSAWEERTNVNLSEIGAGLSALAVMKVLGFRVNPKLLEDGKKTLSGLFPREANDRDVDLAQLSLIYPFNVLSPKHAKEVLNNVKTKLERNHGSARYVDDRYYSTYNINEAKQLDRYYDENATKLYGEEANWTFYFSFMSLCYHTLGMDEEALDYANRMIEKTIIHNVKLPIINKESGNYELDKEGNKVFKVFKSVVPEIFYNNTDIPNDNLMLCWSQSLAIVVLEDVLGIK